MRYYDIRLSVERKPTLTSENDDPDQMRRNMMRRWYRCVDGAMAYLAWPVELWSPYPGDGSNPKVEADVPNDETHLQLATGIVSVRLTAGGACKDIALRIGWDPNSGYSELSAKLAVDSDDNYEVIGPVPPPLPSRMPDDIDIRGADTFRSFGRLIHRMFNATTV